MSEIKLHTSANILRYPERITYISNKIQTSFHALKSDVSIVTVMS